MYGRPFPELQKKKKKKCLTIIKTLGRFNRIWEKTLPITQAFVNYYYLG